MTQETQDSTKIVSHTDESIIGHTTTHIEFMYRRQIFTITRPEELPLFLGRDRESCHIHVPVQVVSRQHCVIDLIQGRIVVKDQSTNGTYVKFGQAEEVCLRKGQTYPLNGRGMIKLGKSFEKDDDAIIYFRCK